MNVEEQIRKEYEGGATYRQLAKKYRKSFTQISRILHPERKEEDTKQSETLKKRISELEKEVERLKRSLDARKGFEGGEKSLREWLRVKEMLETSLDRRFRRDLGGRCIGLTDDGYCSLFHWERPIVGWEMKEERGVYLLNVERHRWMCAFCPEYLPSRLANLLIKNMRDQDQMLEFMMRLLFLFAEEKRDAKSFERE